MNILMKNANKTQTVYLQLIWTDLIQKTSCELCEKSGLKITGFLRLIRHYLFLCEIGWQTQFLIQNTLDPQSL